MEKGNKLSLGLALFPFSRQEKEGRMENYVEHLVKGKIEAKDRGIQIFAVFFPLAFLVFCYFMALPLIILFPVLFCLIIW